MTCPKGFVSVINTDSFKGADGPKGDKGDTGAAGPAGATGARGQSAFDTLPSGTTVRGVIGMGDSTPAAFLWTTASLPAPAPQPITGSDILIAQTSAVTSACSTLSDCFTSVQLAKNNALCTGDAINPTAPAGKVCIYPRVWIQMQGAEGAVVGDSGETSIYGFGLQWDSSSGSTFGAVWAYTAP